MYKITIDDMDLEQIAKSGQCFRFKKSEDNAWIVRTGKYTVHITQDGTTFYFDCEEEEFHHVWKPYFDLHTDYRMIKQLVDESDTYLGQAVAYGSGIRVLNQDLWEVMVSFLISQNNNIPRIKKSIELLCRKFSKEETFPDAGTLALAGVEGLKDLGLGYRDKYIAALAKTVAEGRLDLEIMKKSDYETAHKLLTDQFGIGKKVADCVCLFGLHHVNSFPVDTHIKKILEQHYPCGFDYDRYQGYLGIIQQYMFYYDLEAVF